MFIILGGPREVQDEIPNYGGESKLSEIIWHEFGHSFINDLVETRKSEFDKYEDLQSHYRNT